MVIYRTGDFILTLPDHLKKELDKYQQRFTPEDTDQEAIEDYLARTTEKHVCIRQLFYEALGHSMYEQPKKSESNKIATIMHHIPDWEPAGIQRCGKYGSSRAWKRKNDTSNTKDGFISVTEQMELPFD
ncbi:MAG: hypothetical protein K6E85_07270 [Lachnospiraceae bacterium]|nr:hypothetical protein [Lachnospiraceae bacterium]